MCGPGKSGAQFGAEAKVALCFVRRPVLALRLVAQRVAGRKPDAKRVGKREVRTRRSPLVEETRGSGRDQAAARPHKGTDGVDLRGRHDAEVGQDQRLQCRRVALDVIGMDQDVGDAGSRQRLREPALRLVDEHVGMIAAEEIVVPL